MSRLDAGRAAVVDVRATPEWHQAPHVLWHEDEVRIGPPEPAALYADYWSIRRIAAQHGRGYQSVREELIAGGVTLRGHVTAGLRPMGEETRAIFRDRMLTTDAHPTRGKRGEEHPNYGRHIHSPEQIERYREAGLATRHSEETRRRIGESNRAAYAEGRRVPTMRDPEVLRRWSAACNLRPNRQEIALGGLLEAVSPDRYRCNVDARVVIAGRIPDFVDEERRLVVEMYGDYWHRGEDPADRAALFAPDGYRTLVVWESELADPEAVTARIREFEETR